MTHETVFGPDVRCLLSPLLCECHRRGAGIKPLLFVSPRGRDSGLTRTGLQTLMS